MSESAHLFHVFSSVGPGGPQVRSVSMFNRWGKAVSHTIMAMDGQFTAAERLDPGVEYRCVLPPPRRRLGFYPLQLRKLILVAKPDLVVTYNWGAIEAALGCSLGHACPVVHLEHGFGSDEAQRLKRRRVMARRFVLNRIQAVIVPSRELLDIALEQYRVRPAKVHWIPNGVDVERFTPARDWELRRRLGFADTDVVFVSVGHLRPVKNLELLLHAFALAKAENSRLLIVGDGPCKPGLMQLAAELKLAERVMFAGATDDTLPFYRVADAFVLSSTTEQMPMALLEAMACGLPAVATDVGDVAEILNPRAGNLVVRNEDREGFAQALKEMAQDPENRAATGVANRMRCAAAYSVERMLAAYTRVYSAASRRPGLLAALCEGSADLALTKV